MAEENKFKPVQYQIPRDTWDLELVSDHGVIMPGDETRFQQAMNKGHSAAWDQAWDQAAGFYRQALEESPNNPKALASLGLALFQLQDFEGALQQYLRAAQNSPGDPMHLEKIAESLERLNRMDQAAETLMRAAELYAKSQDVNKALESWSQVVGLKPDHLLAHSRLALVHERLGHKQQAIFEYIAIAGLLQHMGEVPKAIQAVQRALQVNPGSREAGQALAMLQAGQRLPRPTRPRSMTGPLPPLPELQLGAPKETPSQPLDPIAENRQKALSMLAGLLFEEEDQEVQATRRGLQSIVQGHMTAPLNPVTDNTKIMLHLSQVIDLQGRGETAKALDELERAIDAGLEHAAAQFDLGLLMVENNRLESASRILPRTVNHIDFALGSRLLLGLTYQKMGRAKEAALEFLEALRLADCQAVTVEMSDTLSQMYDPVVEAQTGQPPEAQMRLCDNIAHFLISPNWREQLLKARQQLPLQAAGSPPIPLAEVIAEARGGQVVESITKINHLARHGHFRSAMEEAYYAIQFAPTYLPLHMSIGDLLLQQGCQAEAVTKFTVVAHSYTARGEGNRAVDVYRRIIELAPMDIDVRGRLIDLLVERGQAETALSEYLKLAEVHYNMADMQMVRRTYNAAIGLAQQANVSRAWKVKVLHRMADLDLQSLDWRRALNVFEQIRTLQPDDEKARANLIDLNARLGEEAASLTEFDNYMSYLIDSNKLDAAIKFVENIVSENPNQASSRRRLADLYRRSGRTAEAIKQLDDAGNILLDAGDRSGAIEVVMAILALNPPNVNEYRQVLAELQAG